MVMVIGLIDDINNNGIPNYLDPDLVVAVIVLKVYNVVTPNGDGVIDVLRIDGWEN